MPLHDGGLARFESTMLKCMIGARNHVSGRSAAADFAY